MEKHIHLVAILFIALSIINVLVSVIVFIAIAGGGLLSGDQEAIVITSTVAIIISGFILLLSIPGIVAGYGLLKHKSWSRLLTMILAAFNLFNIPFGTMLGIYAFWALLQDESIEYFEAMNESGARLVNNP